MSETLVMPLLNCRGEHGRKGSLPLKAREADRWGCTCAPFLCPDLFNPKRKYSRSSTKPYPKQERCAAGVCIGLQRRGHQPVAIRSFFEDSQYNASSGC